MVIFFVEVIHINPGCEFILGNLNTSKFEGKIHRVGGVFDWGAGPRFMPSIWTENFELLFFRPQMLQCAQIYWPKLREYILFLITQI